MVRQHEEVAVQAGRRSTGPDATPQRRAIRTWLAAALLGASAAAAACPICLGAGQHTVAQELAAAQQAVLAIPTAEAGRFRVVEVIRGERPSARAIEAGYPRFAPALPAPVSKGEALLIAREDPLLGWVVLGSIGIDQASWLRKLAVGKHSEEISTQEWRDRVALVVPRLQSRQPLVAKIAYGDLAAAPYAALRTAKPHLDAGAVRAWLADPTLASHQRLHLLLLGVAGYAQDAAALEQRLGAARQSGDATNLASMLTADLELRGPTRMAWVEENDLRDRARSAPEVEAALLALSVQGHANGVIPRERVIQSYRVYMKAHPDSAGNVAPDLAAWQYWDAVSEYQALMKSGVRQQYPSMVAMQSYLLQSADARASGSSAQASRSSGPAPAALRSP